MTPVWLALGRLGTLLGVTLSLNSLRNVQLRERKEIQPHRIYSSHEAAVLLGDERLDMIEKLKQQQIKGRLVNGNYRIPGASLLEYLRQEEWV